MLTDDEKRELIAKSRKYAKKKRGGGWLEVADTVDRLADALEKTCTEAEALPREITARASGSDRTRRSHAIRK